MPQQKTFTMEEEVAISLKALELKKQGKLEESMALQKSLPLAPYIAQIIKDYFGVDNLIKTGWNLSAVEAEFGPGWFNK